MVERGKSIAAARREAVLRLVSEHPDWPQRRVAVEAGVSYSRVRQIIRDAKRPVEEEREGPMDQPEAEGQAEALRAFIRQENERFFQDHILPAIGALADRVKATPQGDPETLALEVAAVLDRRQRAQSRADLEDAEGRAPGEERGGRREAGDPRATAREVRGVVSEALRAIPGVLRDSVPSLKEAAEAWNLVKGIGEPDFSRLTLPQLQKVWEQKPEEMMFLASRNMPDPVMSLVPQSGYDGYKVGFRSGLRAKLSNIPAEELRRILSDDQGEDETPGVPSGPGSGPGAPTPGESTPGATLSGDRPRPPARPPAAPQPRSAVPKFLDPAWRAKIK